MLFCFRVEICNEMRVCFCLLYNNILKGMWPQYWNASDAHVANHNPCMSAAHNVSFTIHNNSIYQTCSHDEWSVLHVYNRTNVLVILIAFATTKAVRQNFIWKAKYKTTDTNMKISLLWGERRNFITTRDFTAPIVVVYCDIKPMWRLEKCREIANRCSLRCLYFAHISKYFILTKENSLYVWFTNLQRTCWCLQDPNLLIRPESLK